MVRRTGGISRDDINDADFVDPEELLSFGSTAYRTGVVIVSVSAATRIIVIADGGLRGEVIPNDVPSEVNDLVVIVGNAAAGTYTVEEIIDDSTLRVVETIVNASGGTASFVHPSGSSRVGFNPAPSGIPSDKNTVQKALDYVAANASGISAATHELLDTLVHEVAETHVQEPVFSADGILTSVTMLNGVLPIRTFDDMTADADGLLTGMRVRQHDGAGAVSNTLTAVVTNTSSVPVSNTVTKT